MAVSQSAAQYALDGALCGHNSVGYTYDVDGNQISVTHHYDGNPDITTNWYDGADRLVEVQEPTDPTIDNGEPGLTRYLYDISQGGVREVGDSGLFHAYGNLYKTQRCWAATANGPCLWNNNDISGDAFDEGDRPIQHFAHKPFGPLEVWSMAYDAGTFAGLQTSMTNPVNVTTTTIYDDDSNVAQVSSNDSPATPMKTYGYDPDGRTVDATSSRFGRDGYTFDADGRETSYQEASGGGVTAPATLTYGYYANGWKKSLTINAAPAFTNSLQYQYMYQGNGLRSTLAVAGYSNPFSWSYSPAGRMTSQSDPYTGFTVAATAKFVSTTYLPQVNIYDSYGQLNLMQFPDGMKYNGLSHNADGGITGGAMWLSTYGAGTTGLPTLFDIGYNARNELKTENSSYAPGKIAATYANNDYLYDAVCNGCTPGYSLDPDPYTGVPYSSGKAAVNGCTVSVTTSYDAAGRYSATTAGTTGMTSPPPTIPPTQPVACTNGDPTVESIAYDSDNHTVGDATCDTITAESEKTCYTNSYGWDASGKMRLYSTATTANYSCPVNCISYNYTFHWDGNQLLFVTDGSGKLMQQNVETLAANSCESLSGFPEPNGCGLTIADRDFTGSMENSHNSYGDSGAGGLAGGFFPSIGQGPEVWGFGMARTDGYAVGNFTLQGVRAYSAKLGQWTSPDGYSGSLGSPSTQRGYAWNGNNSVENVDPTGYFAMVCDPTYSYYGIDGSFHCLNGPDPESIRIGFNGGNGGDGPPGVGVGGGWPDPCAAFNTPTADKNGQSFADVYNAGAQANQFAQAASEATGAPATSYLLMAQMDAFGANGSLDFQSKGAGAWIPSNQAIGVWADGAGLSLDETVSAIVAYQLYQFSEDHKKIHLTQIGPDVDQDIVGTKLGNSCR